MFLQNVTRYSDVSFARIVAPIRLTQYISLIDGNAAPTHWGFPELIRPINYVRITEVECVCVLATVQW